MSEEEQQHDWTTRARCNGREQDLRVAIIGMGCRFPGGAVSPDEYWQLLIDGRNACIDVPQDRWSLERFYSPDRDVPGKAYVRRGGFLRQRIDEFDATMFGISPREAMLLDPQQRLLLEVSWEAFEDGGIVPGAIRGSDTGVYLGGFTMDNQIHLLNVLNREIITAHTATGSTMGMLSNRLSYAFDLRGPSLSVDTACSSSLVALHLACQGLLLGECEMAVTGGVNVMLRPEYAIAMCKGGFLSPDGLCKAFDASGDGYGRGEGAGIIILKTLRAALRDGDRIRAVIAATGVNQDGRTDGITVPNKAAQKTLIREVQSRAHVSPDEIQYVEAHGTGTRAGDTAEASSLGEGLATQRSGVDALWLGSVKTNLGHLEAAAGVAGIIKTVLALEHKLIPPNLHFNQPHPEIDFAGLRLRVPVQTETWPTHTGSAGAAVNSFGYGGTNAHAILLEAPKRETEQAAQLTRPVVFPVSAASAKALTTRIEQFAHLLEKQPEIRLEDFGYTAARLRTHHAQRVGIVVNSNADLLEKLQSLKEGKAAESLSIAGPQAARGRAKCAFVFTGMGPQFYGMGTGLLAQIPLAREVFERCNRIWHELAGWSLMRLFEQQTGEPMTGPLHAQPANFVLQLMLTEIAASYGLSPDGVVGHSVGEIAAAAVGGSLSLEDALTLTYHRSRLQQRAVGVGKMLAVGLSPEKTLSYLKTFEDRATIAAINSPTSVTVAGDADAIVWLNEVLTVEQIFSRILDVDVAYHSHHMDALAAEFESSLRGITPGSPVVPSYSTVTGSQVKARQQDTGYWWLNARQPVRFADAITAMIGDGFDTFVEIGPHPVLSVAIGACLRRTGAEGGGFALQQRNQPELETLLGTLSKLYTSGVHIDWSKQYPTGAQVSLPNYPWDREALWHETEASRADRLGSEGHPLLVQKLDEPQSVWEGEVAGHIQSYLPHHQIQGEAILPAAAFIEMGLVAKRSKGESVALEGLTLHRTLAVEQTPIVRLHLDSDGTGFNIYSRAREQNSSWTLNANGRLLAAPAPARAVPLERQAILARCPSPLDVESFYETFAALGLQYGPSFRCLREGFLGQNEILSRIEVSSDHADEVADYYLHPTLLDAALQTLLALQTEEAEAAQKIFLPVEVAQIRFLHKAGGAAWCHAKLARRDAESIEGDLALYDDEGEVCAELLGLRARAVSVRATEQPWQDSLLYKTEWRIQKAKPGEEFLARKLLVFCDSNSIGEQFVEDARKERVSCVLVYPGEKFEKRSANVYEVARESREDIARLLTTIGAERLDGIVYLWGLDLARANERDLRLTTGTVDVIDLLHIAQELERVGVSEDFTLCLATARTQSVADERDLLAPGQHALLGLGRVLEIEKPQLRLKMIDLNSLQHLRASQTLLSELLSSSDETEVAFRRGARYVPRIVRWDEARYQTALSNSEMRHALKSVTHDGEVEYHETERVAPKASEVEIEAQFCSIVMQDVEKRSKATLPLVKDERHAAFDVQVAGVVVDVGEDVTDFRAGDEVIVLSPRAELTSHLTVNQEFVVAKPQELSLEQFLMLLDWAVAYYALFEAGALGKGKTVLVHRAETGVGQAAIQLARWKGAEVFATAETIAKQEELRRHGLAQVSDARSLRFADDVMSWTASRGVDVIFGSVNGDIREKSLGVIADSGRFLDISSMNGHGRATLPVAAFSRGLKYLSLDLARLRREQPQELRRILNNLATLFAAGTFDAVQGKRFPLMQLDQALRFLTRDEHIGKVVIDMRRQRVPLKKQLPVRLIRPDASYLVTGGFGGFGLETLKWLAARGGRHIAVLSRSGPASEEAREVLEKLRADGVEVFAAELDISDAERLAEVLREMKSNLPPLRGVIHSAGVIDDAAIDELQAVQVERVMNPKAAGAWNLHQALRDTELDFFACYSSVTSMLGNMGQANYAAANAFMDGLALYRRSQGLSGVSINWGVIGDVGMVSRDARVEEHLRQLGLRSMTSAQALELLEEALGRKWEQFGVFDLDWQSWQRQYGKNVEGRFSEIMSSPAAGEGLAAEFRRKVIMTSPAERFELVYTEVAEQVCRVLQIPTSRVDAQTNLTELGIDSLMATEVAVVLEERTGYKFRALIIVRGPTIAEMSRRILEDILSAA